MTKQSDNKPGVRGTFYYNPETKRMERKKPSRRAEVIEAPFVITDTIDPTLSHTGTNKIYESKSALRREYKELGFIETGGEKPKDPQFVRSTEEEIRRDAEKAYYDIKYDRVPISEREKQQNIEEKRQWEAYLKRNR